MPATRAATTGENPLEKQDNTLPPPPLLVKPTLPATTDGRAIPGLRDCFQKTVSPENPLDQNLCNAVQPSGLNVIHRDDEGSEPGLFDASIIGKVPRAGVVATQRRQTWRSQHQPPPDTVMESRTTSRRSRCSGQPHQRSLAHQLSPRGRCVCRAPDTPAQVTCCHGASPRNAPRQRYFLRGCQIYTDLRACHREL